MTSFRQTIRGSLALTAVLILSLLGSSCAIWSWITQPAINLHAMSFNIRNGYGKDGDNRWDLRKHLVAKVIRDASVDIAGLQEAHKFQLDYLLQELPEFGAVGVGRDGGAKGEYCPILYRKELFELMAHNTFWLSDTPEKPSANWGNGYRRICTWAQLRDLRTGRAFHVYNTHFDHQSQPAREKSARLIARVIASRSNPKQPFVLCGDFNVDEDNPVLNYLKGLCAPEDENPAPVVDSWRVIHPKNPESGTVSRFTGSRERRKIDYIFVAKRTEVLDAQILRIQFAGRDPSDHYPVTARLSLK